MQGVLVYPPFTPSESSNKANHEQDRISSMDNMYFYRTRNWDDPPPTCYVKPAVKPLYRPYVVCIFHICHHQKWDSSSKFLSDLVRCLICHCLRAVVEAGHTRKSFLSLPEFPEQQQNEVSFMISPFIAQFLDKRNYLALKNWATISLSMVKNIAGKSNQEATTM